MAPFDEILFSVLQILGLVWLFWAKCPSETVLQSILGRLPREVGVVGWCDGAG